MNPRQWASALGALALLSGLVGCSEENTLGEPEDAETAATGRETPSELPAACDVVTPEGVSEAYGVTFGPATPSTGEHTENDVSWTSDNCSWGSTDLMEVTLALSGPDDYPDGSLICAPLTGIGGEVSPVEVPGAQSAEWEIDDSGDDLEATLRVCTATANFDIDLEYEPGVDLEGDPREQSIQLAGKVLEGLPA